MTYSPKIDEAVGLALAAGNAVVEITTGWTKVRQVVHMRDPITEPLRIEIRKISGLRESTTTATPHNRAEDRFIDDAAGVVITFPSTT